MTTDETRTDPALERTPAHSTPPLRKLHPLTPFFQSWKFIGAAVAATLGLFRDELERLRLLWDALHGDAELSLIVKTLAIVGAIGVLGIAGAWLSWRVTGFAIVSDRAGVTTLLFQRGIFVRRRSQVRLTRVQSVDLNQPFIPRLFGLAIVKLEMAAGEEASVALAYLTVNEAAALRAEILQHTSVEGYAPPVAERDQVVARVSTEQLIKASLLEGVGAWVAAAAYLLALPVAAVFFGSSVMFAMATGLLPLTIAMLVYLRNRVMAVLRDADFTLYRTTNGLRITAGLTSTINRTIDLDRVQGVRLEEPFLWRRLGWARVVVEVAGSASGGDDPGNRNSLIPVADRSTALALIRDVVGADLGDIPVRPAGKGARTLDPWGYRFLGVALMEDGALSRRGRLRRSHAYVPYARIQSVSVDQGLVQRMCRVATVWLDLPTGGQRWRGQHRDVQDAAGLVAELSLRARRHRLPVRRGSAVGVPGSSEPAVDPGDSRPEHQAEHEPSGELPARIKDRPRDEREPGHEGGHDG